MSKLRTDYEKVILIYCVDDISLLNQWEKKYRIFPGYMNVFVEYGSVNDFPYLSDREKKELALQIVHTEMKSLAVECDWDIEMLEKAYNKVLDLDYKNELVYIKKSSPNKKYVCSIIWQYEVAYADMYLEIREYRTRRLIKKEKLMREEDMYKMFNHISDVAWKLNHKVMLMNDKGKTMWILTFLEKNNPASLVWKIERIEGKLIKKSLKPFKLFFITIYVLKYVSTSSTLNLLALAIVSSGIPRSYIFLII